MGVSLIAVAGVYFFFRSSPADGFVTGVAREEGRKPVYRAVCPAIRIRLVFVELDGVPLQEEGVGQRGQEEPSNEKKKHCVIAAHGQLFGNAPVLCPTFHKLNQCIT